MASWLGVARAGGLNWALVKRCRCACCCHCCRSCLHADCESSVCCLCWWQVSGEEYGEEELDPEWATLLADLDTRLQVGAG